MKLKITAQKFSSEKKRKEIVRFFIENTFVYCSSISSSKFTNNKIKKKYKLAMFV